MATEFVGTSVTSNNLKDITGSPARTSSLAVEAAIQTANRHIKYLNFDDHGFSVLDVTSRRTQMDYYVIGDRADQARRRAAGRRRGRRARTASRCTPWTDRWRDGDQPQRRSSRSGRPTGAAYLFSAARPAPPQAGRGRKRVYVLVVDGCKPGEITAGR